jgi:hypothetical protein
MRTQWLKPIGATAAIVLAATPTEGNTKGSQEAKSETYLPSESLEHKPPPCKVLVGAIATTDRNFQNDYFAPLPKR